VGREEEEAHSGARDGHEHRRRGVVRRLGRRQLNSCASAVDGGMRRFVVEVCACVNLEVKRPNPAPSERKPETVGCWRVTEGPRVGCTTT